MQENEDCLTLGWLIDVANGILLSSLRSEKLPNFIDAVSSGFCLIWALTTYAIILYKINDRKELFARNISVSTSQRMSRDTSLSKFSFVTGLIILSFILFIAVPNLRSIVHPKIFFGMS